MAEPDYLSGKVMEMIIAKLLPEEYAWGWNHMSERMKKYGVLGNKM